MSFKESIKKIIHLPFVYRPFDSLLAAITANLSDGHPMRKLIPGNEEFHKNTIRYCTRNNIRYCVDLNDYQAWLIYFSFKIDSSFDTLKYVNPGDVVIDVGGNIGQTALSVAKKTGVEGKVISFEPYPGTNKQFKKNLSLNPGISNIELVDYGLGDKPGSFEMFQACTTNSGANRITPGVERALAGEQVINVITLDSYIDSKGLNKIDLIKLDVEGFEMKVLSGARGTIVRYKPDLFVEVDDANLRMQGDSVKDIFNYFKELDYSIVDVETNEVVEEYKVLENRHTDILCHYGNN